MTESGQLCHPRAPTVPVQWPISHPLESLLLSLLQNESFLEIVSLELRITCPPYQDPSAVRCLPKKLRWSRKLKLPTVGWEKAFKQSRICIAESFQKNWESDYIHCPTLSHPPLNPAYQKRQYLIITLFMTKPVRTEKGRAGYPLELLWRSFFFLGRINKSSVTEVSLCH